MLTSITFTFRFRYRLFSALNSGSSCTHGKHQVAQKLMIYKVSFDEVYFINCVALNERIDCARTQKEKESITKRRIAFFM